MENQVIIANKEKIILLAKEGNSANKIVNILAEEGFMIDPSLINTFLKKEGIRRGKIKHSRNFIGVTAGCGSTGIRWVHNI